MTRGELSTRIQQRCDRADTTTVTQIANWINELIREIEREYPWAYTKKSQTAAISANVKSFTLPTNLILHHPFSLLLEDEGTSTSPEYKYMIKTEENFFDMLFPAPNTKDSNSSFWKLTGGTDGVGFDVYPVMNRDATLKIASGYYYTGNWDTSSGGDANTNWLTLNQIDLLVEGVAAKLFEHYSEPGKTDRAFFRFQQLLQKAKDDQNKMDRKGRIPRAKTLDDLPVAIAFNKKRYGF